MGGFDGFVRHYLGSSSFEEEVNFLGCENEFPEDQELIYNPCNNPRRRSLGDDFVEDPNTLQIEKDSDFKLITEKSTNMKPPMIMRSRYRGC